MNEFFSKQDEFLKMYEEMLDIECLEELPVIENDKNLELMNFIDEIELPKISFGQYTDVLESLPNFDASYLPRWKTADIPIMIVAGFLGALISLGLHDTFDELHKKWNRETFDKKGHGGQSIDKVRGKGHRLKHGHDILNPFEIDWKHYFPESDGTVSMLKKVSAWLLHLLQDTFSTEGIPLPGSSYFREVIDKFTEGMKVLDGIDKYEAYKGFFTLKMRDITGNTFVVAAISLYVFGTEKGQEHKFNNYRYISLVLGAMIVSICVSLSVDAKKISVNTAGIMAMVPYVIALVKLNKKLNGQLEARAKANLENMKITERNGEVLKQNLANAKLINSRLQTLYCETNVNCEITMEKLNIMINRCEDILQEENSWLMEMERQLTEVI